MTHKIKILVTDSGLGGLSVTAELVEKMVRIAKEFSYEPATPDETREILKLKGRDRVNM